MTILGGMFDHYSMLPLWWEIWAQDPHWIQNQFPHLFGLSSSDSEEVGPTRISLAGRDELLWSCGSELGSKFYRTREGNVAGILVFTKYTKLPLPAAVSLK